MRTKILKSLCLSLVGMLALQAFAKPSFDKSKDLLMVQFDAEGDEDDIHCMAAFACMQLHTDMDGVNEYIVTGARRKSSTRGIKGHELLIDLFGPEGPDWTSAWNDWNLSLSRVIERIKPILKAGGKVWVAEGGQSDFTVEWVAALQQSGMPASTIKKNVMVVQHSTANEKHALPGVMDDVKANTNYYKIADGNTEGNGTAGYASFADHYYPEAQSSSNPNTQAKKIWDHCHDFMPIPDASIHNPRFKVGGVDFSDLSETWWILGLGSEVDELREFWDRYVVNTRADNNKQK